MTSTIRPAPAKINLRLKIVGRRADGYHLIDSWFVPLELFDSLSIEARPASTTEITFHCPSQPTLQNDDNLAVRAAQSFLIAAGQEARVDLRLEKRIWTAAGLGGGSSDAATVLLGLSELLGPLPDPKLAQLALSLGADVPFFLAPRPCRAQGIGERLTTLPPLPAFSLVLLNPGVPLSTAEVYQEFAREKPAVWASEEQAAPRACSDIDQLAESIENDLQPAACRRQPLIEDELTAMREAGASATAMTGSGPTVFGVFATHRAAAEAATKLRQITRFQVLTAAVLAP